MDEVKEVIERILTEMDGTCEETPVQHPDRQEQVNSLDNGTVPVTSASEQDFYPGMNFHDWSKVLHRQLDEMKNVHDPDERLETLESLVDEAFACKGDGWDIAAHIHTIARAKLQALDLSEAKETVDRLASYFSERPTGWAVIDSQGTVLHTSRTGSGARGWAANFLPGGTAIYYYPYTSTRVLRAFVLATMALTGNLTVTRVRYHLTDLCKAPLAVLTAKQSPRIAAKVTDLVRIRKREMKRLRQLAHRRARGKEEQEKHYHATRMTFLHLLTLSDPFIMQTARLAITCENCSLPLVDCYCTDEELLDNRTRADGSCL